MNRTIVLAAMTVLLTAGAARAEDAVAIVVDRDNPRQDITLSELKEIFLGDRKEWSGGTRIIPLDLEPGPVRDEFNRAVLRMDQIGVDRYWVEQRVRGAGGAPKSVSAATAAKLVPRVRGVIAYVPLSAVNDSVKVLTVGGVAPNQPGYPIAAH